MVRGRLTARQRFTSSTDGAVENVIATSENA
jgi:hypothetical protein